MPYKNERATGESLISLEQSEIYKQFKGEIRISEEVARDDLDPVEVSQPLKDVTHVLAIDGSIISEKVRNGFPGAEVSLVQIALVSIDLDKLNDHQDKKIIPPSAFNKMDKAQTLQCVLPGCNIVHRNGMQPKEFFRASIYESLQGSIQKGHESLLETYRALVEERDHKFKCPETGCKLLLAPKHGISTCDCSNPISIYETDPLRFHERFNEIGPNGEAHGEVMRFLEVILLLNVLRFFVSSEETIKTLPKIAFVADGPLAAFGQFAAIVPWVQNELIRLNKLCRESTGEDILLFSLIKSGPFYEHFEQIDYHQNDGPGKKYQSNSTLLPSIKYIHKNIVYRAPNAKPWGADTYYGRIALYKSKSGQRMVLNTPKVSSESLNLENTSLSAYPRLGDTIKIVDRLSTYLFEGGFVPIVRAHSHAAIPLKMGGEILNSLFANE